MEILICRLGRIGSNNLPGCHLALLFWVKKWEVKDQREEKADPRGRIVILVSYLQGTAKLGNGERNTSILTFGLREQQKSRGEMSQWTTQKWMERKQAGVEITDLGIVYVKRLQKLWNFMVLPPKSLKNRESSWEKELRSVVKWQQK